MAASRSGWSHSQTRWNRRHLQILLADMRSIEIIFHSVPPAKKNLIVRLRFTPEFALSSLQSGTG